ncbi:hypothetical protein E2N92_12310 [Methanofollis formosanus]|uniref:Uncharacterized protein n=1 Tax=Methanofollis formosanus TaxID=299308 RepID=A0A8G1A4A8_9EURY|nr:hypothetical protein E2N92_12310 [Methanofollis formosanus]
MIETNDNPPVAGVGGRFAAVFRLSAEPLAVYGSDEVPADAAPLPEVHRCNTPYPAYEHQFLSGLGHLVHDLNIIPDSNGMFL